MQGSGSQLTALRSERNKHLGFPGRHSPCGVFPPASIAHTSPTSLCWDAEHLSEGLQKTAQLPSGTGSRWPFSPALTVVNVLNVLIEKVIFGNILGINWTLDNKFSPHCSSINYFNQIYEVLFGFETSHKFSVIWRPR